MRRPLLALASLSLLLTALGACGTDDDRGDGTGTPASGPAAAELTEDLGCGYGFAITDESEEVLLSVHRTADAGPVERTVSLPDPDWSAEVLVGSHLAANWCNDLIEEPQAEVEETWEVVAGVLVFVGDLPPVAGEGTDRTVRAELTGVVVEGPDGDRVELADVSLSNGAWGFFAG